MTMKEKEEMRKNRQTENLKCLLILLAGIYRKNDITLLLFYVIYVIYVILCYYM